MATILLKGKARSLESGFKSVREQLENAGHTVAVCEMDELGQTGEDVGVIVIPDTPAPAVQEKTGIPLSLGTWLMFLTLACGGLAGYAGHGVTAPTLEQSHTANAIASEKAALLASAEQAKVQLEFQRRTGELQLVVVKACVDRGAVPSFQNGNVLCQEKPK